jgi:hypothetical protein
MKTIFYKKVGRKYEPVSEYDSELCDAMPKGSHLIVSYPGGQSTRYKIDPAYAPMIAAGRLAEDAVSNALVKASELRPSRTKSLTSTQQKLYNAFLDSLDYDARYYLETASIREIAEAGVKAMQDEAMKLMKHESVRLAYEHFLLTCELCKEQENV